MSGSRQDTRRPSGTDLSAVDAYENSSADYDEVPELTSADFARGTVSVGGVAVRPAGRPPVGDVAKRSVTIRLDRDVVAYFEEQGPGWQTRINAALRRIMTSEKSS